MVLNFDNITTFAHYPPLYNIFLYFYAAQKLILYNSYLSIRIKDCFPLIIKEKLITSFVNPEGPKARLNLTGNNFMIFLISGEKCL